MGKLADEMAEHADNMATLFYCVHNDATLLVGNSGAKSTQIIYRGHDRRTGRKPRRNQLSFRFHEDGDGQ